MVANLEQIVKNLIDALQHNSDVENAIRQTIDSGISADQPVSCLPFQANDRLICMKNTRSVLNLSTTPTRQKPLAKNMTTPLNIKTSNVESGTSTMQMFPLQDHGSTPRPQKTTTTS